MKINNPVTQNEVLLQPAKPLVSKTDLKGIITYANENFIQVSGFSREELIGKNHNIIRHPEMPPEAFADLWNVLKAGHPWRGLVKNRCKNGDFYWVEAFVSPIRENGQIVGYMSIRSIPDRREVEAAASLYCAIREGRSRFPASMRPTSEESLGTRLAIGIPLMVLMAMAGKLAPDPWGWVAFGLFAVSLLSFGRKLHAKVLKPMIRLKQAINDINEGKLATRIIPPGGPLDALFIHMEGLRIQQRATLADVLLSARELAAQGEQLAGAIQRLEFASGQQSERVMQVAAAMEEMSVSVNEIAGNTEQSLAATQSTDRAAARTSQTMQDSTASVQAVVSSVGQSQSSIREMTEAIGDIGNFAGLIKDIADQTNLLALNAAIEAARAGESGRGFAVVADEVRKLAERSAKSTADISRSLAGMQSKAEMMVTSMDEAMLAVDRSTDSIHKTAASLDHIASESRNATEMATSIRGMLNQQSSASLDVAASMEGLSALLEQNHQTTSDISTTMQHLCTTSGNLRSLIQHLEATL
ncbi:MAG: PAS domain-containing protein [Dechloromonas sp.]|nr:PAS domain-containing protein [Dechloromonas sp.]